MKKAVSFISFLFLWSVALLSTPTRLNVGSLSRPDNNPVENIDKPSVIPFIASSALVSYGIATRFSPSLRNFDKKVYEAADGFFHKRIYFDDYLQYAPSAAIYIVDLCGIKAKNDIIDRTFIIACSHLMMGTIVYATKELTNVKRPDTSAPNSFPSGHAATAFTGAHILFKEYRDTPWVWITGYAVATATGTFRVLNKRHWFSDVMTGAGVGILCTELTYLLLPTFQKMKNNVFKNMSLTPRIGYDNLEMALYISF